MRECYQFWFSAYICKWPEDLVETLAGCLVESHLPSGGPHLFPASGPRKGNSGPLVKSDFSTPIQTGQNHLEILDLNPLFQIALFNTFQ